MAVSEKSKVFYLFILILFLVSAGFFWLDYIGLISIDSYYSKYFDKKAESVLYSGDDEPSLIKKEEFEKEKTKFQERVEELDKRELKISEQEKFVQSETEKLKEIKDGIELEKKKLENEKEKYKGYQKNIVDLASKIQSMPPKQAVDIMVNWEDPLIIAVLRQMDENAAAAGTQTITSYLISLMPKEKASHIMYLMTQL